MKTEDYISDIEKHLNEDCTYRKTTDLTIDDVNSKVSRTLDHLVKNSDITSQMAKNLTMREVKVAKV